MLEPTRFVYFKKFGNRVTKKNMDFDTHSNLRKPKRAISLWRKRKRIPRMLSVNDDPVNFEYLVLKLLDLLEANKNYALLPYYKSNIYKAADDLEEWANDEIEAGENLDILEFFNFVVDDPCEEHLMMRESEEEQFKSCGSDHEPPIKKRTPFSMTLTEKHHLLVRYVEKRLRRYILDDHSIEISANSRGIVPPPASPLRISYKKHCLRSLFEAMQVSSDIYKGFFKPPTDEEQQNRGTD